MGGKLSLALVTCSKYWKVVYRGDTGAGVGGKVLKNYYELVKSDPPGQVKPADTFVVER
jgi:hypothetical protein